MPLHLVTVNLATISEVLVAAKMLMLVLREETPPGLAG
jgi:hypothetical protein